MKHLVEHVPPYFDGYTWDHGGYWYCPANVSVDQMIGPAIDPKNQEYYHYDAHEKATETWNLRALGGRTDD